jgi:addiction module RelB/DinJ family antitoxin
MSQVTINAKTDLKLKTQATKLADDLGISLTVVINNALRRFVAERSLTLSEHYLPSEYLIKSIVASESEYKKGQYDSVSSDKLEDYITNL